MTITQELEDRATRARACECLILAYALACPTTLPRGTVMPMSEGAAFALDVILSAPHRSAALALVVLEAASAAPQVGTEAVSLIERALALSVDELAQAGDLLNVVELLRSERLPRTHAQWAVMDAAKPRINRILAGRTHEETAA